MAPSKLTLKKGRKYYKGKGKKKYGKKAKLFADVKSFKLTGIECALFSTVQSGSPSTNVSSSGIGLSIANLTRPTQNTAQFVGTYISAFNNVYQAGQLKTLFDRYKIHGVKLKFIPQWTDVQQGGSEVSPVMKIVSDYDDPNINDLPNTVSSIWARQGKIFQLNKPFSVYIRPKLLQAFNNGLVGTPAYGTQKATYLNMSYPNVPHYAMKFAIKDWYTPNTTGVNIKLKVEPTYYVSLREQICPNAQEPALAVDEEGNLIHQNVENMEILEFNEEIPCEVKPE